MISHFLTEWFTLTEQTYSDLFLPGTNWQSNLPAQNSFSLKKSIPASQVLHTVLSKYVQQ